MSRWIREWRLSCARVARAGKAATSVPPAISLNPPATTLKPAVPAPEPIEKFAKEPGDLDALQKTVEESAAVSTGFWLSYLFVLFYIGIAAGAVTHKDLLLENPVKLPFLNVELPLVAFFVLAPILFIISHAYTLVHFVMLGAKAGVFDTELNKQFDDAPARREGVRRQLPSNIFVQFLAGPRDMRSGGLGWLLKAISWISLVIGPVLLLLLIQVQFLPYHLEWVTWLHRFAVLADVVLLWLMWPAVLNSRSSLMWRLERRGDGWLAKLAVIWRYIVGLTISGIPIWLAFTVLTFPGESLSNSAAKWRTVLPDALAGWLGRGDWRDSSSSVFCRELLFNGEVDDVTRRRKSLFSNTLVLPGFDALEAAKTGDPKTLDSVKHALILRGRHLESAVFDHADLSKADLEGAHLQDAKLGGAQLQGASLNSAKLQGALLNGTRLQGAALDYAQLQDAKLGGAQLQDAKLGGAQLQGASLNGSHLQGASLYKAQLQGASLDNAQLQGAQVDDAQLQGASLYQAQLQGASLINAQLQGASLVGARLQGAALDYAQLQGASLDLAWLQGASLDSAQLHGASLDSARLQGANFGSSTLVGTNLRDATVWRTNVEDASLTAVLDVGLKESALSRREFAALKARIMREVPESEKREQALKRIEKLNPGIFGPELSEQVALKKGRVQDATASRSALADQIKRLACSGDEFAPYIVRGLIANDRIKETGAQAPGLVEAILKPDCPVSAALTEVDQVALKERAKQASGAH